MYVILLRGFATTVTVSLSEILKTKLFNLIFLELKLQVFNLIFLELNEVGEKFSTKHSLNTTVKT